MAKKTKQQQFEEQLQEMKAMRNKTQEQMLQQKDIEINLYNEKIKKEKREIRNAKKQLKKEADEMLGNIVNKLLKKNEQVTEEKIEEERQNTEVNKDLETKIDKKEKNLQQLQNKLEMIKNDRNEREQKLNEQLRKERTKRLIETGGMLEKMFSTSKIAETRQRTEHIISKMKEVVDEKDDDEAYEKWMNLFYDVRKKSNK